MWTLAEKSGHILAKEGCQLPEDRKIEEETLSYGLQEKLAPCSLALGSLSPRTMKGTYVCSVESSKKWSFIAAVQNTHAPCLNPASVLSTLHAVSWM